MNSRDSCCRTTSVHDGLVGDLQHEAELWVHGVGLFGMDSKEGCIEAADVLQFTVPLWEPIQTWNRQEEDSHRVSAGNIHMVCER